MATAATTAFKCLDQQYREFPHTEQFWEEQQKPQLIAQGVSLSHLQVRSPTLEDLFLELTGHQLRA